MRVAVVAVGDELLSGDVTDTAVAWVGRLLAEHGIRPVCALLCGDAQADIATGLCAATAQADAIVLTGGLGSTSDDRTRDALAGWAGVPLERDNALVAELQQWYAQRQGVVPPAALRQADVPRGAKVLPNPTGSAPGLCVRGPNPAASESAGAAAGVMVWALPGVPSEMRAMFTGSVLPALLERAGADEVVRTSGLRIALAGETAVAALLGPLEQSLPAGVSLSFLPECGELRVRATARAPTSAAAQRAADATVDRVRRILGGLVVGAGEEPLEVAVHRLLGAQGHTLAVAESLTGGMLAERLTAMPGSSAAFRGGIVAYAAEAKSALLGVDPALLTAHGAVHPEVALAMARGARERLTASHGLATTGVAGPDEQDGQAVGTVFIGVSGPTGERVVELALAGDRERVRRLSVVHALDALRRLLSGLVPFDPRAPERAAAVPRWATTVPTQEAVL